MDLTSSYDQSQCRLLSLPAELRNHVWNYVLIHVTKNPSVPNRLQSGVSEDARERERFCANILRTCKQINAEGTPILYGENKFLAHPSLLTSLPSFLLLTQPHRISLPPVTCSRAAKLIRRFYIHVRLDTDPRFSKRQLEESFTGVEELEVEVFQGTLFQAM